jgi:hypothetical protein
MRESRGATTIPSFRELTSIMTAIVASLTSVSVHTDPRAMVLQMAKLEYGTMLSMESTVHNGYWTADLFDLF